MDNKTLTALKKSIEHWQENVDAETPGAASTTADDCALCNMFLDYDYELNDCVGCPIFAKTGDKYCHNTPYYRAADAWGEWKSENGDEESFKEEATKMRDFLIDLLPEGEK